MLLLVIECSYPSGRKGNQFQNAESGGGGTCNRAVSIARRAWQPCKHTQIYASQHDLSIWVKDRTAGHFVVYECLAAVVVDDEPALVVVVHNCPIVACQGMMSMLWCIASIRMMAPNEDVTHIYEALQLRCMKCW